MLTMIGILLMACATAGRIHQVTLPVGLMSRGRNKTHGSADSAGRRDGGPLRASAAKRRAGEDRDCLPAAAGVSCGWGSFCSVTVRGNRKDDRSGVNDSPTDGRTISDQELLQRHLDGDAGGFPALVKRYERELFNFLVHFTGDRTLAEDIFQEAFFQLHVSAAGFDMSRRLKPWLFTIAANKARDALRSRSRRQAAPLDATIGGGDDESGSYAELIPANIPGPDESSMNLETRQAVQKIVEEMPDTLRTVLLLCYFQEFAYKEIAEILAVPLGTVKSRLHAALKHFAMRWKAAAKRLGYDESEVR